MTGGWIKFDADPMKGAWPTDGQRILGICGFDKDDEDRRILTGEFTSGGGRFTFYADDEIRDHLIAWQPLPEVPEEFRK